MARRILHDTYFKQAKAEGYVARSAFKLQQIQEAKRILKSGDRVLDLGCAPGAWIQVAGEIIGPRGRLVGIDLQPTAHVFPALPEVVTLVGDIYKTPAEVLLEPLTRPRPEGTPSSIPVGLPTRPGAAPPPAPKRDRVERFDVVLSDMAPNTTGHGDHERSVALCEQVLHMLPALLRKGGNLAMKVFEGGEYPRLLKDTAKLFESTKGYKPKASRDASVEMYIVASGFRGVVA